MEFYDVVKQRKSVRRYASQKVPEEALLRMLEAARLAPSWGNRQCTRFIVVDDAALAGKIVSNVARAFNAQVMIVACADPGQSGHREGKDYYLVDVAISMEHLVLAATAEGLGTCWLGGMFDEQTVKKELGIPDEMRVVAITPVGYPAEGVGGLLGNKVIRSIVSSSRKPLAEIAFRNRYGSPL